MTNPPRAPRAPRQTAANRLFQTINNTLAPGTDRRTQRQSQKPARNKPDQQSAPDMQLPAEPKAPHKRPRVDSPDRERESKKARSSANDRGVRKQSKKEEAQPTAAAPNPETIEPSRPIKSMKIKKAPMGVTASREKSQELPVEKVEAMGKISSEKPAKSSRESRKELQVDVATAANRGTLPTPPSSKDSPPGAKRKIADVDGSADAAEQPSEKRIARSRSQRQATVMPLNEPPQGQKHTKPEYCKGLQPTSKPAAPNQEAPAFEYCEGLQAALKPAPVRRRATKVVPEFPAAISFAPVVRSPEVNFVDYGDSIPILQSTKITRLADNDHLLTWPNVYQRVEAFALLERAGGFTGTDLGRVKVADEAKEGKEPQEIKMLEVAAAEQAKNAMKGPTNWIDDCDLYLHDSKIHVATEAGLLLAADYLRLAGIPDTTPVRFKGVIPGWAKAAKEARYIRRFTKPNYVLQPDRLAYHTGHYVMVYDHSPMTGMAYGRRMDDNTLGWFLWVNTGPMDTEVQVQEWEIPILFPEEKKVQWNKSAARSPTPPTPTPGYIQQMNGKGATDDAARNTSMASNQDANIDEEAPESIQATVSDDVATAISKESSSPDRTKKYDRSVEDEVDWDDD